MVDLRTTANPLFLREDELRQGIELMFFAHRDFASAPDRILERHGLGRAHHRAIYFIGRHPGLTVGELLAILKVTKQSLARVLAALVGAGLVTQETGRRDRRTRELRLTAEGAALERELTAEQRASMARAYRAAGAEAVQGFRKVLLGLVDPVERARLVRSPDDEDATNT